MIYPSARDLTPFTSRDFDQSPLLQGPKPSPHLAQMSSLFVYLLFIYLFVHGDDADLSWRKGEAQFFSGSMIKFLAILGASFFPFPFFPIFLSCFYIAFIPPFLFGVCGLDCFVNFKNSLVLLV